MARMPFLSLHRAQIVESSLGLPVKRVGSEKLEVEVGERVRAQED